jgi:hypothetical protein
MFRVSMAEGRSAPLFRTLALAKLAAQREHPTRSGLVSSSVRPSLDASHHQQLVRAFTHWTAVVWFVATVSQRRHGRRHVVRGTLRRPGLHVLERCRSHLGCVHVNYPSCFLSLSLSLARSLARSLSYRVFPRHSPSMHDRCCIIPCRPNPPFPTLTPTPSRCPRSRA